jgi:hypothetical protein
VNLVSLLQRVFNDLSRARSSRGSMIWLLGHLLPPSPVSKLDRQHAGRLRKRDNLLTGGGRGGRGAESHDRRKAWSSIQHSMLSGLNKDRAPFLSEAEVVRVFGVKNTCGVVHKFKSSLSGFYEFLNMSVLLPLPPPHIAVPLTNIQIYRHNKIRLNTYRSKLL